MIGSQPPGVGTYPKKILLVIGTHPEHLPSTTTKTAEHQQHARPCHTFSPTPFWRCRFLKLMTAHSRGIRASIRFLD